MMKLFVKIIKNEKPFPIFVKSSISDVSQDSGYASELAFKIKDVSFLNQGNRQLSTRKKKHKEPTDL